MPTTVSSQNDILFDGGISIKAIKNGKGTIFINSLSEDEIVKAAKDCVTAAEPRWRMMLYA